MNRLNQIYREPRKFTHAEEFRYEYIQGWIDELKPFEFEFKGWGTLAYNKDTEGMHYLRFKDQKPDRDLMGEDWDKLIAVCTQDDDGQPHATYRYYNGDLHIFIPYYG